MEHGPAARKNVPRLGQNVSQRGRCLHNRAWPEHWVWGPAEINAPVNMCTQDHGPLPSDLELYLENKSNWCVSISSHLLLIWSCTEWHPGFAVSNEQHLTSKGSACKISICTLFGVMAVRCRLDLSNTTPKFLQLKLYCMTCTWEGESDGQNLAVNRACNLCHCCLNLSKHSPTRCTGLLGSSWGGAVHVLPCPTACTAVEWHPALLDLHTLPEKSLFSGRTFNTI